MKKQELINLWLKIWLNINDINEIIQKTTGLNKIKLFLLNTIEKKHINKIQQSYSIRKNWLPIEYITNKADFFWLDFFVDNRALIPRNDTELMVEQVLNQINSSPLSRGIDEDFTLIDVWTWSCNIPIPIIKHSSNINKCFAIETSKKALEIAKINIQKHNLENKITLFEWNLLDNFKLNTNSKNIIITANLPYIKDNDVPNIDKEVILFEPPIALYWWKKTWFELYEKLIEQILTHPPSGTPLNTKGRNITLFIEIWFDQHEYAKTFLESQSLKFESFKDNNWIFRCVKILF